MLKNPMFWGLLALIVGCAALAVYFQVRVPPGLEPMGDHSETIVWVSLATAVVSLLTAVTGLVKAIVEARANRS